MTAGADPLPSWPAGEPRVLVTDCSLPNAGDAAIALALGRMLRRISPGAAVLHAAYGGDLLAGRYPELPVVPPLDALLDMEGAPPTPASWNPSDGAALVRGADIVISQGGGFLLERYSPWNRLLALERVAEHVPVAFIAQSIGRFRSAPARRVLGALLRRAVLVTVRDARSRHAVAELGRPMPDDAVTSDLTLTLETPIVGRAAEPKHVVVVVTDDAHAAEGIDRELRRGLSATVLAETLAAADASVRVRLLSTSQGLGDHGYEDDAIVARATRAALPAELQGRVDIVEGYLTADDVRARLASAAAVVSQRLHPALFALTAGVPAALVVDTTKGGVLDGARLGSLVCRAPLDDGARRAAIDEAVGVDAPRGESLTRGLDDVRARAATNETLLREVLDRVG